MQSDTDNLGLTMEQAGELGMTVEQAERELGTTLRREPESPWRDYLRRGSEAIRAGTERPGQRKFVTQFVWAAMNMAADNAGDDLNELARRAGLPVDSIELIYRHMRKRRAVVKKTCPKTGDRWFSFE